MANRYQIVQSQTLSCLAMLSAGTSYVFSLYGPSIQSLMSYSQSQIGLVAISGNAGVFLLGPFWGYLCDHYPDKTVSFFGIGGSMIALGYYSISLYVASVMASGEAAVPHYLILALLNFLVGTGSSAVYHCSLSTNYRNWPSSYRSVAIGLSVSFFGLSAFVFASLGSSLFVQKGELRVDSFLQLLAFSCFGINLLAMGFLHPFENPESPLLTRSPSAALPFISNEETLNSVTQLEESIPLLLEQQFLTIGADFEEEYQEDLEENIPMPPPRSMSNSNMLNSSSISNERTPLLHIEHGLDSSRRSLTLPNSESLVILLHDIPYFTSFDAYLLAYIMFTIAGVGLMYINHVGSIVLALFPPEAKSNDLDVLNTISIHVQMLSIGSFLSRIVFGILSDLCFTRYSLQKSTWAVVCCCALLMGELIIVAFTPMTISRLYGTTFLIAISYGGAFTVLPILVGQFFGLKNFSRNWGWMTVVPAIGGQAFSYFFGTEYDAATGSADRCLDGVNCFQKVFDGATAMTVIASIAALFLLWKRQ